MKAVCLAAVVLFAAPLARAQDADTQARVHFEAGRNYNATGDYESAAREFARAYELSHRPGLLFNLYSVYERLGDFAQAANYLERFLADEPNAEDRATLEQRLVRLRERASAGQGSTAAPADAPSARPASTGGDPFPVPAVVVTGVGAAALLSVAVLGGLAAGEDASVAETCGRDAGRTCTSDDVATLNALNVAADSLLAIGLVTVTAGVVLWIVLASQGGGESVAALPWISPSGDGGLALAGRF
jgi:tetratricopeptide (TPR) repeat protein